jgi:hypothetical protein
VRTGNRKRNNLILGSYMAIVIEIATKLVQIPDFNGYSYLPNQQGVMTHTKDLVYIDMPYLADHVNLIEFNLVHNNVRNIISEKFRVTPLNDIVDKQIQDKHSISKLPILHRANFM